ncbi:MAG: hypothetical protein RIQ60_2590, partial [Pseudomonadota bacterium]
MLQRPLSVSRRFLTLSALLAALAAVGWAPVAQAAEDGTTVRSVRPSKAVRAGRAARVKGTVLRRAADVAAKPSFGQTSGLHATQDPLALKSSVALVVDQDTSEVLFSKNTQAVLPIA